MADHDRAAQLAQAWDDAADGYDAYFVPRFAPWIMAAVAELGALPAGPILVPCCGTFPELEPLIGHYAGREIVGIDLSPGMVRRAQARAAGRPGVRAVVGDAVTLGPRWTGECAAVLSVFGLQQLPDPAEALRSWATALRPGGRLSVVYWPETPETGGPFALIEQAAGRTGDDAWEAELLPALTGHGIILERNELLAYPIVHPDAAAFFDAFTTSGPMRTLANARGATFVGEMRRRFLHDAPRGEWRHEPAARLIVARAAS